MFPEPAGNIRAHGLEVWGRVPFGLPTDWSLHHPSLSASRSVPLVEREGPLPTDLSVRAQSQEHVC